MSDFYSIESFHILNQINVVRDDTTLLSCVFFFLKLYVPQIYFTSSLRQLITTNIKKINDQQNQTRHVCKDNDSES